MKCQVAVTGAGPVGLDAGHTIRELRLELDP